MDRIEIGDEDCELVDTSKSFHAPAESLSDDTPRQKEQRPKAQVGKGIVAMMIVVSLFSSTAAVAVYDRFFAQKIVTINLRQYMENQRDLYLSGKLTADQVKQNLDGFIASVKAAPKNKVILLEDVVANSTEKLESR